MSATTTQRAPILALLKDVAESEHRLRHQAAFQSLVEHVGLEMVTEGHRVTVRDWEADQERMAAETARAQEAAARHALEEARAAEEAARLRAEAATLQELTARQLLNAAQAKTTALRENADG
jgi:hypothetical protein